MVLNLIRRFSDRDDMRQVGHGIDRLQGIEHSHLNNGKTVILFDDVTTTGKSFRLNAEKLIFLGAEKIIGVFLAKTWDKRVQGEPDWINNQIPSLWKNEMNEEDDLPF